MKTMKMTRMKRPPIKTTLANLLPDNLRLNLLYWALPLLLYLVASQSNLVFKGGYAAILSTCNIVMAGAIYTQIGSSMAGSAVQGQIVGKAAALASKKVDAPSYPDEKLAKIHDELLAPLNRERGYSPEWVTQTLQGIMIPNFVLYIKKERMMQAALAYVEELKEQHLPNLIASNLHELRLAHETENMIHTAEMKMRASLMRKESRCSHYRLDYPEMDDANWQAWINIYQGEDGSMQMEKQPFGDFPKV